MWTLVVPTIIVFTFGVEGTGQCHAQSIGTYDCLYSNSSQSRLVSFYTLQ